MVGNYFSPNEITPDDYHVKWKLFETLESKKEDNIANSNHVRRINGFL